MTTPTPRCDHLARELARPTSGPFAGAGNDSHKIIDWIALAQQLERELAEARRAISETHSALEALQGMEHVKLYMREAAYALELREALQGLSDFLESDECGSYTRAVSYRQREAARAALAKNPGSNPPAPKEGENSSGGAAKLPDVPVTGHIPPNDRSSDAP